MVRNNTMSCLVFFYKQNTFPLKIHLFSFFLFHTHTHTHTHTPALSSP